MALQRYSVSSLEQSQFDFMTSLTFQSFSHIFFVRRPKLIKSNLIKIGPPTDPLLSPHIQSICEALDIPHLETRFDIDTGAKEFSINLYPQQQKLNDAILETVKYLNWTRYAIIYEGNHLFRAHQKVN
jgi:Receptor family ligand binding region